MRNWRVAVALLLLPAILFAPGCTNQPQPPPKGHECLDFWGDASNELLPLLKNPPGYAPGSLIPPAWARKLADHEDYIAVQRLRTRLAAAMGQILTVEQMRDRWEGGGPPGGSLRAVADNTRMGLDTDALFHTDAAWLSPLGTGTEAAKTRAGPMWSLLHEALDM